MRRSPLNRKTPLAGGGELRRTKPLNGSPAAGAPLPAAEPGARGKPIPARRAKDTGPSPQTVALVAVRDESACVRCGGALWGVRGRDYSFQHRRARGAGGSRRADTNEPQNLIMLCGSASTGCHGWVELHPADARGSGWAIRQSDDPLQVPVWHWQRGLIFLRDDGSWSSRPPTAEEAK